LCGGEADTWLNIALREKSSDVPAGED
jgi:hypothetical protein